MVAVSASEHPHLYRAVPDPTWLRVRPLAFKLRAADPPRRPTVEKDLSVFLSVSCTKAFCEIRWSTCLGEFILKTEDVLADGWRVEKADPKDRSARQNHASIFGLPFPGSPELEIELAASRLADLVETFQPRPTE
jgi:hypothetical protein